MARDQLVTAAQAAELGGVAASTWRAYVARGQAPAAAYRGLWWLRDVERWAANRPGQGTRTDLRSTRKRVERSC